MSLRGSPALPSERSFSGNHIRAGTQVALPKRKLGLNWDYKIVRQENRQGAYPRGWVCDHWEHLVAVIQTIGLRSLITHLVPPIEERNDVQPWSASDRSFIVSYLEENLPYVDPPNAHGHMAVLRRIKNPVKAT
jgi:hypothetical protein